MKWKLLEFFNKDISTKVIVAVLFPVIVAVVCLAVYAAIDNQAKLDRQEYTPEDIPVSEFEPSIDFDFSNSLFACDEFLHLHPKSASSLTIA